MSVLISKGSGLGGRKVGNSGVVHKGVGKLEHGP